MALIKCPECEKEISNQAKICPHCGYPIGKHERLDSKNADITEKSIGKRKIIYISIGIGVCMLMCLFIFPRLTAKTPFEKVKSGMTKNDIVELYGNSQESFQENRVRYDQKYKGIDGRITFYFNDSDILEMAIWTYNFEENEYSKYESKTKKIIKIFNRKYGKPEDADMGGEGFGKVWYKENERYWVMILEKRAQISVGVAYE